MYIENSIEHCISCCIYLPFLCDVGDNPPDKSPRVMTFRLMMRWSPVRQSWPASSQVHTQRIQAAAQRPHPTRGIRFSSQMRNVKITNYTKTSRGPINHSSAQNEIKSAAYLMSTLQPLKTKHILVD